MGKDLEKFIEPSKDAKQDQEVRENLDRYFSESIGTNLDKLNNFPKYVTRQALCRFLVKYEIFKKVLNVHGSIIECGVLFGGGLMTFAQLSAIFEPLNHQRKIIGFDTFCGFPEISDKDRRTSDSALMDKGGFAVDSYADLQYCLRIFDSGRFLNHIPKVFLIKGDARETIPDYLAKNPQTVVSLLYVDFDLFEPTKVALECFLPRMPKGAIIAFDQLNDSSWPGETLAVSEVIGIKNLRIQRFGFGTFISYSVIE
jgi:hypothetical protein